MCTSNLHFVSCISVSESDDLSSTKGSQGIKAEKYELATHTVKVRRTGALADVQAIWDLPGTSKPPTSC